MSSHRPLPHSTREPKPEKVDKARGVVKALSALGYKVTCSFEKREATIVASRERPDKIPASLRAEFRSMHDIIVLALERAYIRQVTKQGDERMNCNASALLERCLDIFPGSRLVRRTISAELNATRSR